MCLKEKFTEHIFTDTLSCVYRIIKINIFFRPEEAMFENWQKLVSTEKFCSVLEKLQIIRCQTEWEVSIYIVLFIIKLIYITYTQWQHFSINNPPVPNLHIDTHLTLILHPLFILPTVCPLVLVWSSLHVLCICACLPSGIPSMPQQLHTRLEWQMPGFSSRSFLTAFLPGPCGKMSTWKSAT